MKRVKEIEDAEVYEVGVEGAYLVKRFMDE